MGAGGSDPDGVGESPRPPADPIEVRPSRVVGAAMGAVAGLTALLAVAGVAIGEPLLGVVALVSAVWLGSVARTSWQASSVADDDGVEVVWVRVRRRISWAEVDSIVIEGVLAGGTLGSTTLVVRSGAHLRWAPWYPFLWFTHRSVRHSIERLVTAARARGIEVTDVAESTGPDRGPSGAGRQGS